MTSLKRNRLPYKLVLSVVPLHALKVAQYELAMLRLRVLQLVRPIVRTSDGHTWLNIGCGRTGRPGWVNIDSCRLPGVTLVADCRSRLPLPDHSAQAIFTEHMLEHVEYDDEAPRFLAECIRILTPGGTLRIVVPDGRKYLLAYASGDLEKFRSFSPYVERDASLETPMEVVNAHFRQAGQHRFSYDAPTLCRLLTRCGFAEVTERQFGESRLDGLAIDSPDRARESLYVEAVRP